MKLPRLYPILDTASLAKRAFGVVDAAEAMIESGAEILQFRHKGHFTRKVFAEAERIGELCRQHEVLWVVDDRADIAKLLGAGLHLGQDDLPPAAARRIVGDKATIGFSTHNAEQLQAAAAEPVDYLAIGPIFETGSKKKPDPVVGLERLTEWRTLTGRPLVAIGGITIVTAG
ncbi:MAG: thiamine phosphate synthase, partial [bacterium]|nr:thiamine phosphate synthase [bacterium]